MNEALPKYEYGIACNILEAILKQSVEDIELTDAIPPINDLTDSNKVFKGKLSILFVDMRKSTDLTDEIKSKNMVKVYRSFIRMVVQAVRYCGGQSRQFAGDGVMGVFQDNPDPDNPETSCQQAVRAGRYILTLIDYCLNPKLKKHLNDVTIGCGVGICTGIVMATKVGMRGKETDDTAENEMGIVWVGSTTNYASRFCSLALPREIFIDENTYKSIAADVEHWKKETRVKGTKTFTGYLAKDFYLSLPDEVNIEPVLSDEAAEADTSFVQNIFDETEERALQLVDEISKKSAELSLALDKVKKREEQIQIRENQANQNETRLGQWQQRLQSKQEDVDDKEKENKTDKYYLHKSFFSTAYPSDPLIKQIGKEFWCKLIANMYALGAEIGYSKNDVILDLDYYLIDIYFDLDMFKEAYDVLCVCAQHGTKVLFRNFEIIVKKSGHWYALKENLEQRIKINHSDEFVNALQKIKAMGY